MLKDEKELLSVVRNELGNRGYVVNIQARREGDLVVGHVQVTSAETDETVARVVGAGKMENLNLCFGVDAEGTFRDAIVKVLTTWQGMQTFLPAVVVRPPGKS